MAVRLRHKLSDPRAVLWYLAKVLYIVGALHGFLAEYFTLIRKPVCIENMNLLNFPPFSFVAKVY